MHTLSSCFMKIKFSQVGCHKVKQIHYKFVFFSKYGCFSDSEQFVFHILHVTCLKAYVTQSLYVSGYSDDCGGCDTDHQNHA